MTPSARFIGLRRAVSSGAEFVRFRDENDLTSNIVLESRLLLSCGVENMLAICCSC